MTPEQIAAKLLLDINEKYDGGDSPLPNDTARALLLSIATALRQARNQALEEAAGLSRVHRQTTGDENKEKYGSYDLADAILSLKHKDGQP